MTKEQAGPIELVKFHGDDLAAIKGQDGKGYVVIRRICDNLGVDYSAQLRNLKTTHAHWSGVVIMTTPDERGRDQEHAVIAVDRLPMWLANIKPSKVAPEIRERIKLYQVEAADVLARHFMPAQHAPSHDLSNLAGMVGKLCEAIAGIAINQTSMLGEINGIKAEQLRFATQGRTVIYYVPAGYHRFSQWCKDNGVPKPGPHQAEEIHRARELSSKRGVPVYRCEVNNQPAAYYFTDAILREWVGGFRRRHPGFFYKTFPSFG